MTETTKKRPTDITIICIFMLIASIAFIVFMLSPYAKEIPVEERVIRLFCIPIILTCIVGLWKMKKWATYTYTGLFVMGQIILIVSGEWEARSFIIPGTFVFFALKHISKMT